MRKILETLGILQDTDLGEYRKFNKRIIARKTFILGIIAFMLGGLCYSAYVETVYESFTYSKKDVEKTFSINNTRNLSNKLLNVYISTDLNQAILKYSKSISYPQLRAIKEDYDLSLTEPYGRKGKKDYYPAGCIAETYFQDEIFIDSERLEEGNIAYENERRIIGYTNYKPNEIVRPNNWSRNTNANTIPLNFTEKQKNLPLLNDRFINWINIKPFISDKKLWGKFKPNKSSSSKDPITVNVKVRPKNGKYFKNKEIIITEPTFLGIKNNLFVIILLLIGSFALITSIGIYKNIL